MTLSARTARLLITALMAVQFVVVLVGLLMVVTPVSQSATSFAQLPLLYAPLPLLIWAAVRFGPPGLCITLVAALLLFLSQILAGPSVMPAQVDNIITLVVFLVAIAIPLLLAAFVRERQRTEQCMAVRMRGAGTSAVERNAMTHHLRRGSFTSIPEREPRFYDKSLFYSYNGSSVAWTAHSDRITGGRWFYRVLP
jgi:hypothetical protein